MPLEAYPSLTFVTILHLALAIIKALTLLCVEEDAWDLETAQMMLNIPEILQQLSRNFDTASNLDTPRCRIQLQGSPMLSNYAEAYRGIERWYLSKLNQGPANSNPTFMEPTAQHIGDPYGGFDFWDQLSDLTHGFMP